MRVAKEFRFEAAHRLPWHEGACSHLHGHSYRVSVVLEGDPDERGMLVDFQELKRWMRPLIQAMDHATLVSEDDQTLLEILQKQDWKTAVLPYDTTAENVCRFLLESVVAQSPLAARGIREITVRVAETETCYAELTRPVDGRAQGR